ncbi:MAG: hypothetical protein KC503_41070 [Myxococcales bacterium]|nr:hypothetical protein [Myxococcales bacterium]
MRSLALTLLALATLPPQAARGAPTLPWFISAKRAAKLAASAQLLDARDKALRARDALPGATPVDWRTFSQRGTHGGLLLSAAVLTRKLRALGVRPEVAVLVLGDPRRGWGEAGRVVWMLRAAGHRRAAVVDGGVAALRRAGVRQLLERPARERGNFRARARLRYDASMARVRRGLADGKTLFIDSREGREYNGATPYGERRGGHLPGAKHLYYKRLLDPRGLLLSRAALRRRLAKLGATPASTIISYCSGGVRSAWLTVALQHAGFRKALNYAGSMWQWAAQPAATYPLVR